MDLPGKYAGWVRTRSNSFLVRKNIRIYGEDREVGRSWDNLTPYVDGNIQVTLDGAYSNWKWSRRMIAKDPDNYGYLKSVDFGGPFVVNHITYTPPTYKVWKSTHWSWSGRDVGFEVNDGSPFPCFWTWQRFQHPLDIGSMPVGMEFDEMWTLGGSMIAKTMPTVPDLNLSVSIAEILREGLPKKLGSSLRKGFTARHAADEFLNYTFGWSPILADLRQLALVLPEMEDKMKQIIRDNRRTVRRRLEPVTVTTDESWNHMAYVFGSGGAVPQHNRLGLCEHAVTRTNTTWFSAAYFYDLPSLTEVTDRFAQMRMVLGLNVDAQTIWNLIPWSWLVDWVVPVSPILQNLSVMARNNVRIQRAYIMVHSRKTETATNGSFSATLSMETKQRDRASPWGFGVKSTDLSATQLAILASLGLSRANI